ncbi:fibrohexamerin-like isoform X2 [Anticarsia gemmatalis]|uniref:fibrohexamerin-like isoform X2 n=1 Tax=Anticarsia gemmatalis TaxID=129554 RepID=UPI003F759AA3
MKRLLCFIFLFGLVQGNGDYWVGHIDGYGSPVVNRHETHHAHIEKPCHLHDTNCIRQFFARNSGCTPVHGPAPDPYIIKKGPIETPHSNVTITINNAQLKGLNTGRIKEFYINKKTGVLVLEVVFGKIVVYSPRTVVTHHLRGREPEERADFTNIEFIDMSLTLTIPYHNGFDLAHSHVYTYMTNKPHLIAGPGLTKGEMV